MAPGSHDVISIWVAVVIGSFRVMTTTRGTSAVSSFAAGIGVPDCNGLARPAKEERREMLAIMENIIPCVIRSCFAAAAASCRAAAYPSGVCGLVKRVDRDARGERARGRVA